MSVGSTFHRSEEIGRHNVAALIPAYFEGKHIGEVVRRVKAQLDTVFVVDDGSTDRKSVV